VKPSRSGGTILPAGPFQERSVALFLRDSKSLGFHAAWVDSGPYRTKPDFRLRTSRGCNVIYSALPSRLLRHRPNMAAPCIPPPPNFSEEPLRRRSDEMATAHQAGALLVAHGSTSNTGGVESAGSSPSPAGTSGHGQISLSSAHETSTNVHCVFAGPSSKACSTMVEKYGPRAAAARAG
jgi:hypothetical protein